MIGLVSALEVLFWLGASVAVYTYVGYPFLLGLVSRLVGKPWQVAPFRTSVSIILAVYNEEGNLPRRLNELTSLIEASGLPGEVVVVSDGSTDCSEQAARAFESRGGRVFRLTRARIMRARVRRKTARYRVRTGDNQINWITASVDQKTVRAKRWYGVLGSLGFVLINLGSVSQVVATLTT
jgi:hypothetical protein